MNAARLALVVVASVASLGAQLAPQVGGASASQPELALTGIRDTARWSGHFADAGVVVSAPEACAVVACDEVALSVTLPQRPWNRDGGLQVGLRWPDEEQDLDLFVYGPDGRLAARSDGVYASMAESVLIPAPHNGRYRIVVVPRETEDLAYEGVVQIERGLRPGRVRDLVPDLIALPPRHATFSTGAYFFSEPAASPTGCYPEEMIEEEARRCLRFDQILANVGDGPFELRYDLGSGTDQQLRQRVHRSDGSWSERRAGSYEFHPTHAHFHYRNFAVSRLWESDAEGRRLGDEPVRPGRKNGFCVTDIENIWFGRYGDAARSYYFPQCIGPTETGQAGPVLRQGMSVGWGDVYNWFLPGQYIEVSGVPDGFYLLETIADADQLVLETNEDNNSVLTLIRICGDEAAFVEAPSPSCDDLAGDLPRTSEGAKAPGRWSPSSEQRPRGGRDGAPLAPVTAS